MAGAVRVTMRRVKGEDVYVCMFVHACAWLYTMQLWYESSM